MTVKDMKEYLKDIPDDIVFLIYSFEEPQAGFVDICLIYEDNHIEVAEMIEN